MLMACHLYSVWKSLDVTRNAEPEHGNVAMAPQDVMATRKRALELHMSVYEPWQSPDEQTLGWVVRNHERKRHCINDLSKINSQTPEPNDPTFVGNKNTGRQVLGNNNGQAVWVPDGSGKADDLNYKGWLRRLELYLVAEHLGGFKLFPDGSWVTPHQLNIYRSHVGQHVIHAKPNLQIPFKQAQQADMSIRGEWMKYVRMGKKLGEAIEMSIQFMHIKMTYNMQAPIPIPNSVTPSLTKGQINHLI